MKRFLTLLTALVMAAAFLFTACGKNEEAKEYSYSIGVDSMSYSTITTSTNTGDGGLKVWLDSILTPIRAAFGTSGDTFTLKGTAEECDAKVQALCKGVESILKKISGGTATVVITNNTTGKTVYTFKIG